MSSEESTTSRSSSSRLSQFGIYRTIDARTEEFLKLSKKRQIRQGCACAVISTALTVTIVVAIILIYEYNGFSNPKPEKELLKTSNITKNATKEKSRHEGNNGKFNKKKHAISTSTINLLNLLLKALNHTHNLEGQEKRANSPTINKLDVTDLPFKRNVFSDIKNWIRVPNLRMLAEHRAPSIFYYRNPTTNVKLASNTRKPSIYPGTDISKASEEVLEKSPTSLIKTDHPQIPMIMETKTMLPENHMPCSDKEGEKSDCNCSKLSAFLCKVLSNIQELFPGVISNTTLCNFNSNVVLDKAIAKLARASNPLNKTTDSKTVFTPTYMDKTKGTEKNHSKEVFQGETGKYVAIEDKEHKKYSLTNTNKLEKVNKIERTPNSLNKSTKIPLDNHLQSVFQTKKEPEITTKALQPYIVAPEFFEYLKYFIKSTTAATTFKSVKQHKSSEKVHVTDTLNNPKYLITDIQKSTDPVKSNQHEIISEKNDSVTLRSFVVADIYKDNQNYLKTTNVMNNGNQNNFQNKKNKIISKNPSQLVIKRMKIITERPQYTTVTVRPYIVSPESTEYNKKSTTDTKKILTVANTVKRHKIGQNLDVLDETTTTEIITQEETLTAAVVRNNDEIEQSLDTEKESHESRKTEIKKQKKTSITATAIKHDKNLHTFDTKNVFDGIITTTETTTLKGTSSVDIAAKNDKTKQNLNIDTVSDKTNKNIAQEKKITIATASKKDKNIEQDLHKENALDGQIKIIDITRQNEALSTATTTIQNDKIEQNLDIEKALDGTIRTIEIMTRERTSTDATSKKCDKIKQNLHAEEVLDGLITNTEVKIQKGISIGGNTTKHDKMKQANDEMIRSTLKPMQTTETKYFKDEFYEINKPFKDIKFARFDSFAANSNKHIILPSYKDLNFELFPVFKRHNMNTPKFDTNSELLIKNDSRMYNDFMEIMSSNKKEYYRSASNEMINTNSAKNHDTTNKIKSSSMPIEETSPINRIFEIKMMNDKIKETLEENIYDANSNPLFFKGRKSQNQDMPEILRTADKHPIWTYNVDNDFVETTKPKLKLDYDLDKYETTKDTMLKTVIPNSEPSATNINKQTVSISELYDTNKSLMKYLNKTIQNQTNETDKTLLKISYLDGSVFFEDIIQDKLKFLRDTKSKANNNAETTMKYSIPKELMTGEMENNPSSMLPKSRPSYLEINRDVLNIDEDQDYQMNTLYYKQKRQNYDYLYDILN